MNFTITESQLKLLIEHINISKISKSIKDIKNFSKKVSDEVKKRYKIDVKILMTWSTSVGGFMLPLDNYIRTSNFQVTDEQISLILIGVSSILFFDNEDFLKKIISTIKDEGLYPIFKKILSKGQKLKKSFISFLNRINISTNNLSIILSYSILIPIISDIQTLLKTNSDISEISELITNRILASITVTVSSEILYQTINSILNKLKETNNET